MKPDDPRHGTEAGAREHYRHGQTACGPCRDAHRRRNTLRLLYPAKCLAIGSQRRIQALQAIGYGRDRIARELGYTDAGALSYIMRADTMLVGTAERIAAVYERLCMTVPVGVGPARARTWAKRHGYAPPLAWDDIDNLDERPVGWQYRPATRAEHFDDLLDRGAGITAVCAELGIGRAALERWAARNDRAAEFSQLVARETPVFEYRNGAMGAAS